MPQAATSTESPTYFGRGPNRSTKSPMRAMITMPMRCSQHITQGESPAPKPRMKTAPPTGMTDKASTASETSR